MSFRGDVSFMVKRAVGFIPRFTIAQLADATGLAYEQVEQVVRRLKDHEFVSAVDEAELRELEGDYIRRVGRPRKIYALTDDKAKRNEFFAALDAIESAVRQSGASERRPSTVYYEAALEIIQALEVGEEEPLEPRMDEAASLLEYGRGYEGLIPEGAEVSQAYYDIALARLRALSREHGMAQDLLRRARERFDASGLTTEVRMVDERLLCLEISRYLSEAMGSSGHIVSVAPLQEAAEVLRESDLHDDPTLHLLRDAVEMLVGALPERTWEEALEEYSGRLVQEVVTRVDAELQVRTQERELIMTMDIAERRTRNRGAQVTGAVRLRGQHA